MDRNKKNALTIVTIICLGVLVYSLAWVFSDITTYKSLLEKSRAMETSEHNRFLVGHYKSLLTKRIVGAISVIITCLTLITFNLLMWFNKTLFGVPLTPEQQAERKRIRAERKKERLQQKLNKL